MRARATDNLGLKAVSLLLGFSLWYAVAREQGAEFAFHVPIELRNVPEGLEVIDESVQQVEVRLRGPAELLRRLSARDLRVGVDLSDAGPGERAAYFTPEDISAPFGVRVMRVTPPSVTLELDRTLRRTVKVIPRVLGSPAEGFELYNIELSPEAITVIGPASRIRNLEQVTTEPLSAEGLREPYSRSVRVELDPLVRPERAASVEVTLVVREERIRRELGPVPLTARPEGTKARLRPETIRVVIEGPRTPMESLSAEDLEAELRIDGLSSGQHRLKPLVRLSRDQSFQAVRIVSVKPEEIAVRIQ